jgi:hypothetical protein
MLNIPPKSQFRFDWGLCLADTEQELAVPCGDERDAFANFKGQRNAGNKKYFFQC